jgi:glycosyltransferase involved in cell wall biosynthesis
VQPLLPHAWAVQGVHQSMAWFDRWCATRLDTVDADAVICYENAALQTFRAARKRGMTTILDAASFHHAWQDRHYDYPESDAAHARITAHKDKEIVQADHVLTVSELARESYIEGGVAPEQVTAIPVGCDLSLFAQSEKAQRADPETPFTFIFAGHAGRRKGIDILIEASAQLDQQGVSHRVWVAGGEDPGISWEDAPSLTRLGRLSQERLAERFRQADALVLPSRHDSFGMVVVEALATGCPVLLSEQTGAKQAIIPGESGWILPAEDTAAWVEQMAWCVAHPEQVRAMASEAHAAAQHYTWDRYRSRVASFLEGYLEDGG